MSRHALEPPPTLMGLMMSCNDLPSTLTSGTIATTAAVTPPSTATRPSSTWHSEVETYASAGSTAVDQSVVVNTSASPSSPASPASKISNDSESQSQSPPPVLRPNGHGMAKEGEKVGFVAVTRPRPSAAVSGWDRSEDDEPHPESPPHQRGRLGHIISMSGLKRSLSQSDLAPRRKPSRIKSAMVRVSRQWQQHFGHGASEGGERPPPPVSVSEEPTTPPATATTTATPTAVH
ncbi:hypothetical protein B0H67DRAFT_650428 [Lasiosphaeris hirsuta]|uniref:Uncharacterized protein n=1 Tax=Lasiosphaeris hirsuta TaxID=260670 RepID=A0AA39ZRL7_9PEZI|nr:hypothetical protein B0H67DRAFT_650428 [Lasiosphaeris hirsuta]